MKLVNKANKGVLEVPDSLGAVMLKGNVWKKATAPKAPPKEPEGTEEV